MHSFFIKYFDKLNLSFNSLEEMILPLKNTPQIMVCPREIDFFNPVSSDKDTYLGPCINLDRKEEHSLFLSELRDKTSSKIIYASMGSQTKEYPGKALKFFNSILKTMRTESLQRFHLVLSVGSEISNWQLDEIPDNVSVFSWVPQLEVLRSASVAIIHGGLGSVKECIYFNVPMLVIPMGRDQMDNAKRVEHRQVGIAMDVDKISTDILAKGIQKLLVDEKIKSELIQMQLLFRQAEKTQKDAVLV